MADKGVGLVDGIDVGASNNWGEQGDRKPHEPVGRNIDRRSYGLLQDLKSGVMLDDTLVVFTSEFGRTPWPDSPKGRSHHKNVYSTWIAGGGSKPGIVYGSSDEMGAEIAEDGVHVHDLHATLLHLLGLDYKRLPYRH